MGRSPLWSNRDFRLFWVGQSTSVLGSEITALAVPLTAVLVLGASPAQMGLLTAAFFAPYLLFGLLAGVWVDRYRRRPILITTDLVSAAALAAIPLAVAVGRLGFEVLFVVQFVIGTALVVANVAYQSLVPSLVDRRDLVDANAALEVGSSTGSVVGPSLGGFLCRR